jgi:hypothetical protein
MYIHAAEVNANLSLRLIKYQAMKTCEELDTSLTSELDRGEWVRFTPWPIYPRGGNLSYPLDGRVGGCHNWRRVKDIQTPIPWSSNS